MGSEAHDSNLLAAYLEDRLDSAEHRRVVAHLAECAECRGTLAAFARASAGQADVRSASRTGRRGPARRPYIWLGVAASLALATVAGVGVLRLQQVEQVSAPSDQAPPITRSTPPPVAPPTPGPGSEPQTTAAPPQSPALDAALLSRRSGERHVAGKTFRLIAGEWIDTAYDPVAGLPEVRAATPQETSALLERVPTLGTYTTLGASVVVVHEGTVYRLRGRAPR